VAADQLQLGLQAQDVVLQELVALQHCCKETCSSSSSSSSV
jgi:hypothetical protein